MRLSTASGLIARAGAGRSGRFLIGSDRLGLDRLEPSFFEGTGVGGHVDRVLAQGVKRHDFQGSFVSRGQHDVAGRAVAVGAQPVRRGDAPAVAWPQAGELESRHGSDEVIADAALMVKELGRHDGADRVAAEILGAGVAAAIAIKAGYGIVAALLKLAAEHVPLAHGSSIAHQGLAPAPDHEHGVPTGGHEHGILPYDHFR